MKQFRFARRTLAPLSLALTLAACGGQAPTTTPSAATQDGPPAGATVLEQAATPAQPISALSATLEKDSGLREFMYRNGRLDGVLARAEQAKSSLSTQAKKAPSCQSLRWVAELGGRLRVGHSLTCSAPFVNAWMEPRLRSRDGTAEVQQELDTPGDGTRKSAGPMQVSLPLSPNRAYEMQWYEVVEFADGTVWYSPDSDDNYYISSSPKVTPRTPQKLKARTFKAAGTMGTQALVELTWSEPPTIFVTSGYRLYDVTTGKRELMGGADDLDYDRRDREEEAGAYTPGLKRKYQLCNYNLAEELCGDPITARWDGGQVPVAALRATPVTGDAPLRVNFDASASRDQDGRIVSYSWQFGDWSSPEDTTGPTVSHVYERPGEYQVTLTVTDDNGNKNETVMTQTVKVTDPAPQVTVNRTTTTVNGAPSHRVDLSWAPARGIAATEYRVTRQLLGSSSGPVTVNLPATATAYTDPLGTVTESYALYTVCAVNSATGAQSCSGGSFLSLND